jgi:hypothetical protein
VAEDDIAVVYTARDWVGGAQGDANRAGHPYGPDEVLTMEIASFEDEDWFDNERDEENNDRLSEALVQSLNRLGIDGVCVWDAGQFRGHEAPVVVAVIPWAEELGRYTAISRARSSLVVVARLGALRNPSEPHWDAVCATFWSERLRTRLPRRNFVARTGRFESLPASWTRQVEVARSTEPLPPFLYDVWFATCGAQLYPRSPEECLENCARESQRVATSERHPH